MHLRILPEVFKKHDISYGIAVITGLNNQTKSKDPAGLLKQAVNETKNDMEIKNETHKNLKTWIRTYEKLQMNYKRFPFSILSMVKTINAGKPISSINPIVDLYNTQVIKTLVPMGAYDLDTIDGDMEVRLSEKNEIFTAVGKTEPEKLDENHITFADRNSVLCAYWAWKQSNKNKVTKNTRNIILRVEGLGLDHEKIKELTVETANLIKKYCGGTAKTFIITRDNPEIDLSYIMKNVEKKKISKKDIAINEIINRGTVDVIVRHDLLAKLESGKKLRIKLGIDPSGSDLHIGHMVPVKKLREFQKMGHHILLLFGNFTGQIGDPSGKSETRNQKTQEELEKNAQTYIKQVSKVLDTKNIEVVWNADWLKPLSFADVVRLSSLFTVSQMLERDMYKKRIKKDIPIYVHEFMYPLMQGYDSVALKADVEIGGTDQTFNLLAGRTIQKVYGQEPQNVVTVPILEGTDGKIKMGKSENNYIGVSETPDEQYGKIMSIPDELILRYFELATEIPLDEINNFRLNLAKGANPRDLKMRLAREIVALYNSETDAKKAEEYFIKIFQKKEIKDADIPELKVKDKNIIDIIVNNKLCSSRGETKRLIHQGAVKFKNKRIEDVNFEITEDGILQVGKKRFIRIKI